MYTIKGEHYYNDYTSTKLEKRFSSLEDIYEWMKNTSDNFSGALTFIPNVEKSIGRITINDSYKRGYVYFIKQIENENGIVYSDGTLTNGKEFCAAAIKRWVMSCRERMKTILEQPNFVECDEPIEQTTMVYLLHDVIDDRVDGVIISNGTETDEIDKIIGRVKEAKSGEWTIDDIKEALPNDCTLYYQNECGIVLY